eukprot:m.144453 g.144453  ORF g.144453 m.144453 type:complete len:420 (-) comp14129_c0_seq2:240-1499(-)
MAKPMTTVMCYRLDGTSEAVNIATSSTFSDLHTLLITQRLLPNPNVSLVILGDDPRGLSDKTRGLSLQELGLSGGDGAVLAVDSTPVLKCEDEPLSGNAIVSDVTRSSIRDVTTSLEATTDNSGRTGGLTQPPRNDFKDRLYAVLPTLLAKAQELQRASGVLDPLSAEASTEMDEEEDAATADTTYDPESEVDATALDQLLQMGFPKLHCIKALLAARMDPEAAMLWLLDQPQEVLDAPITPPPKPSKSKFGKKANINGVAYRQLSEMGFEEDDIMAALLLTHNNFQSACDMLLSGVNIQEKYQQEQEQKSAPINERFMEFLLDLPGVRSVLFEPRCIKSLEMMQQDMRKVGPLCNDRVIGHILYRLVMKLQRTSSGMYDEDKQREYDGDAAAVHAADLLARLSQMHDARRLMEMYDSD